MHFFQPLAMSVSVLGVDVVTSRLGAAAMLKLVDLEKSRRRIEPVGKGAHRDAAADGRAHALAPRALSVDVHPSRQPVACLRW